MACACQGGATGQYEIVTAEGTVPAQVNGAANSFATQSAALGALRVAGTGGFVRTKRQTAGV